MPNYYMPSYPLLGIDEARAGMEGAAIDRVEFVTIDDDDDPEQDYFCLTLSTGLSVYGSAPSVYGQHPEHAFYSPHVVTRKDTPIATHAERAFDVLTNHDLSPSTRDLVTIEGIAGADWADGPGERLWLLDEILAEYEAKAVEASAINAIVALRIDVQEATCTKTGREI